MKKPKVFLAIDLGASSGRVMAGLYDGRTLTLEEVHRFANGGTAIGGHLYWDFVGLHAEIKRGLAAAARAYGARVVSVGADTWGVDYGLLDRRGNLLGLPHHYRDTRTSRMQARAFRRVPRRAIYETTGIQFMPFNTVYQLMADAVQRPEALAAARRILFAPDLLHYWLCGRMANEYTAASTSQLLDARKRRWSKSLATSLGLPAGALGPLVEPGTDLGPLLPEVQQETGLGAVRVVAPGGHDTASAVAAVPAEGASHAYLSSGTWSLMGVETRAPVIDERTYAHGFTNEGGVCGTIRLLKNICGLWLVQESRRAWKEQGREVAFEDLRRDAQAAPAFASLIDPDHPDFSTPGDMPARIAAYCARTRQPKPATPGAVARTIYESLALRYREVFACLEDLVGHRDVLHVVGGGVRETVLNQFTADALNRPVLAGPVEATAIGNILMQLIASGDVRSLDEGRALVRTSFPLVTFEPKDTAPWKAQAERFAAICKCGA